LPGFLGAEASAFFLIAFLRFLATAARPSLVDVVRTVGLAVGRLLSTNAEEGKGQWSCDSWV